MKIYQDSVDKIPLVTIKQSEQCTVNIAERNNQLKSLYRTILCESIILPVVSFVLLFLFLLMVTYLSGFFCPNIITLKLNFEIKGDTQLNGFTPHESEIQLSSLLDNNSTQYFESNNTFKFVEYMVVSSSSSLVPEVRVIHDFHGNLTSIINDEKKICHIMPITRTRLYPPVSLSDLKIKVLTHFYVIELEMSMYDTVLDLLSDDDLSAYGEYIPETCGGYETSKMTIKM